MLIDTGFIQVDCLVGVGLNNEDYAAVRSRLARERRVPNYSVGQEEPEMVRSGIARVSIVGLDNSEVETGVAEVGDNLLGVCYFHRLKN
ncbi:MAG: hypothetical protein HW403_1004 [Dehalococcoidia bacterium]|nr:hypothetical protein [Dehalococcoidia bacterium]